MTSVPRKRQRDASPPSDTDKGNPHLGLETPPPSSPSRASETAHQGETSTILEFSLPASEFPTRREHCLDTIRKRYSGYDLVSLNDLQILCLCSGEYTGPMDHVQGWLETTLEETVGCNGDIHSVLRKATALLDQRVDHVTGRKPPPGASNMSIRPVDGTEYSIRLWPGAIADRAWCLDFVHSETRQPKNQPFEFELWAVPLADPRILRDAPWLSIALLQKRLQSLECSFGLLPEEIHEGQEKFVVRDGQTCLLKRPGQPNIRFTVPNRTPGADVEDDTVVMTF